MKDNSEIIIPDDAIQLLDEITMQCNCVLEALHYVDNQIDEDFRNNEFVLKEATEQLFDLLNFLGNKWCAIDPLIFDSCTNRKEDYFHFLFYEKKTKLSKANNLECRYLPEWWVTGNIPDEVIWRKVPAELGIVLYRYETETGFDYLPPFIIKSFKSLKTKLSVSLRVKSVDLSTLDSTTGSKTDLESVKPSLTSSGRVICCTSGEYTFTKLQSPVIRVLWKNFEAGNDFMPEQDILEEARLPDSSFASLFKSIKKKKAWSIFEQHPTQKDLWRLKLEQTFDLEET